MSLVDLERVRVRRPCLSRVVHWPYPPLKGLCFMMELLCVAFISYLLPFSEIMSPDSTRSSKLYSSWLLVAGLTAETAHFWIRGYCWFWI
jgi:hypothetical protein